jgi:myo-inositol 2-dehydrogenase / D-chiro-inositol 1-dehydrogenase
MHGTLRRARVAGRDAERAAWQHRRPDEGPSVTVKVGVVGTGVMGAHHVATLHRHVSGAAVTAIADVDAARARAAAEAVPGVAVAADAAALIADPEVDAVVIASHDSTHAELARAAVQAGKPVMCEKPLAPSVAECEALIRAQAQALTAGGAPLISLGFMRRFDPAYRELKLAVDAASCGTPLLLHCVSRAVRSGPGATHEFDIVPWLLGSPIVEVSWQATRSSAVVPDLRDPQLTLLRTADGVVTTLEFFANAGYGYDIGCEVVCEQGTLALAPAGRVVSSGSVTYPADWRARFAAAYRLELQAWIDAIAAGRPSPLPTARDGLIATAIAEVIASMHDGGRFVAVEVPAPESADT